MINHGEPRTLCTLCTLRTLRIFFCWEVGRAWTCMPSIPIQPKWYQPNSREKSIVLKGQNDVLSYPRVGLRAIYWIKKKNPDLFFAFFVIK